MTVTMEPPAKPRTPVKSSPFPLDFDPETHKIRWTRAAAYALVEKNMLDGAQYELLGGEIYRKVKNRPHVIALILVKESLEAVFGASFIQTEDPVAVSAGDASINDPEPDAAVLIRPAKTYLNAPPGADDVRLIVEVSDSTLRRDLGEKAALYARAGYGEYWVLDIAARHLHVHREPSDGAYQSIVVFAEDAAVSPIAASDAALAVRDLLPPDVS